jgi:alkylation response protein AidB-like acyl-CoA dehydrogenase
VERTIFSAEHDAFRALARDFLRQHVVPNHADWEREGIAPREALALAGRSGLVGFNIPEEYGGGGVPDDFRFNAIVAEEMARAAVHAPGLTLNNDIIAPYLRDLANDEQRGRWLKQFASGELLVAIAMTEPGAGSDLAGISTAAKKADGGWTLSGSKTFISGGIGADCVIVVARSSAERGHRGLSLFMVESGIAGFTRGRRLEKLGLKAQDTGELFFDNAFVPDCNVLGEIGQGFSYLMQNLPTERLSMAVNGVAVADTVFRETLEYCCDRKAFGHPIGSFQHNRFALAEMSTEIDITQAYIDRCIVELSEGNLTAIEAAKAKWWATEMQKRVVDRCLQLHGGYGYMTEYSVAKAYVDARAQTIYGGTTEIMKEIIGRDLGL